MYPNDYRYTKDHEYIAIDGDTGTVGITDYAQSQLGDVVFVELPDIGKQLAKGDEAAVVESVKAASEVYAPVSGEVVAVNDARKLEMAKKIEKAYLEVWKTEAAEAMAAKEKAAEDAAKRGASGGRRLPAPPVGHRRRP